MSETGEVELEREGSPIERFPLAEGHAWPTPVIGCASTSGESALIGLVKHDRLLWFGEDAATARGLAHRRCEIGERIPHAEQLQLMAVQDGFIVLHENGLLCVDARDGHERWRIDRVTFDWRFVDAREGVAWLADADDNLLGFDLATGFEHA